ncbi:MAG: T9SS C-terminal target domain-containing protein, partial [Flavobacteriales bacterium]
MHQFMRQQLIFPLLLAVMTTGVYEPAIAQTPPDILWQHNYGGSSSEAGRKILPTNDGGYIVTARTQSNDGDVIGYYGLTDIWIIKLNALGELEWQRCMGGSDQEWNETVIRQTSDGGYILGAYTNSTDGDVECSSQELSTIWVTKLDVLGNVLW